MIFNPEYYDWRSVSSIEQDKKFADFLKRDRLRDFEMRETPLMRLCIFNLDDSVYKCLWSFHHILLDDRGFTLVLEEVDFFYEAFTQGLNSCPETPRPYRDYALWVGKRDLAKDEEFWRKNLAGFTSPTPLVVGAQLVVEKRATGSEGSVEIKILQL